MTTPATELRTAADKLRTLAGQATPGPWVATWRGQEYQLDGNTEDDLSPIAEWTYAIITTEPKASEQRAECDTANADHIAAMHPGVGAATADLLEAAAGFVDDYPDLTRPHIDDEPCSDHACRIVHAALTLARAINRSQP